MAITADKGIKVGIFSKTFANDGPHYGDPAFSFLVAQPLFASDYTYSTIKLPDGNDFNNKLTLTIKASHVDGLRLDEQEFNTTWVELPGTDYVTGWLYVSPGTHNVYHVDPSKTFMALATGTEEFNSYAFASGMRLTQINRPCIPSSPTEGDILDNDCDGQIDEELENGIDDDGDGSIDEDFSLGPRVNGNWGEWGNWSACSVTCIVNGTRSRTRACDNPAAANNGLDCSGDDNEVEVCDNTGIPCGGQ
ncbi:hemicentin-1 [Elysia marginata]|uniref:Hemicentin-1 n=1 Tax=Elysia marginata TaxID=1093978 RepID=A0AAV4EWQ7_9GAST|nr:hemicentin-1 [Elysia marginata]